MNTLEHCCRYRKRAQEAFPIPANLHISTYKHIGRIQYIQARQIAAKLAKCILIYSKRLFLHSEYILLKTRQNNGLSRNNDTGITQIHVHVYGGPICLWRMVCHMRLYLLSRIHTLALTYMNVSTYIYLENMGSFFKCHFM